MSLLKRLKKHRGKIIAFASTTVVSTVSMVCIYFGIPAVAENAAVSIFAGAGVETLLVVVATTVGKVIDDRRETVMDNAEELDPFLSNPDDAGEEKVIEVSLDLIKARCLAIMQAIVTGQLQNERKQVHEFNERRQSSNETTSLVKGAETLLVELDNMLEGKTIAEGVISFPTEMKVVTQNNIKSIQQSENKEMPGVTIIAAVRAALTKAQIEGVPSVLQLEGVEDFEDAESNSAILEEITLDTIHARGLEIMHALAKGDKESAAALLDKFNKALESKSISEGTVEFPTKMEQGEHGIEAVSSREMTGIEIVEHVKEAVTSALVINARGYSKPLSLPPNYTPAPPPSAVLAPLVHSESAPQLTTV